jgi:hypothetical protein
MTALAIARLRRQLAGAHPTADFQARLAAALDRATVPVGR